MELAELGEIVAKGFEIVGVLIIIIGGLHTLFRFLRRKFDAESVYDDARRSFGQPLMLGLEVLVAADIIGSIMVDPSLNSVAALGLLVLIRVVLSFSIDVEVDGMFPWRRASLESSGGSPGG